MIESLRGTSARRLFTALAWVGLALTVLLAVVGQIDPDPYLDPFALTVSDYAVADRGGVTDAAMMTFGASALALLMALRNLPRGAIVLLGVFAAGMFVAAIAPTDPGTHLSGTGQLHRYASVVAFVALPLAGLLLTRRAPDLLGRAIGWVRGLVLATGVFMVAMLVSSTVGDRLLVGLAERLLLTTSVVLMAALVTRAGSPRWVRTRSPLA
ncbi:DUF998 domain-containing protein [Micromonospora polyrhachis]|uniref:DUF998 domain-containing protein n=1 Tax=Micromonospora polyrhachis TaxID=1282883 RepID=A0A7W7STS8_9ACTN|nr:DUF998 domain-containing protein [Micromonospora polyrhachis]MBB4960789.1 hypothetical protein [Micromonospora polyrhachis]